MRSLRISSQRWSAIVLSLVAGLAATMAQEVSFEDRWKIFEERQKQRSLPQISRTIGPKKNAMAIALRLDADSAERLDGLAEKAIDESFQAYLAACRVKIESMSQKEQETALARSYLRNGPNYRDAKFDPFQQAAWTNGLKELLTPDQRAEWKAREERLEKENQAMHAELLLALIIRDLGISVESGDGLRGAILEALEGSPVSKRARGQAINTSTYGLVFQDSGRRKKVVAAVESEVADRLDEWLRNLARRSLSLQVNLPKSDKEEEEDIYRERVVAAIVEAQMKQHFQRHLAVGTNRLAEVDRVAGLDPVQRAELELAMQGMAELAADGLANQYEVYARNFANRVKDGNYQAILKNLRVFWVEKPRDDALWQATLSRLLRPEQKQRIDDVLAERKRFEDSVALRQVRYMSEELLTILPEQWAELKPLIEKVIEEKMPEYERQMPHRDPWYFDVRKISYALQAVGDEQLKETLTDRQWQVWSTGLGRGAQVQGLIMRQGGGINFRGNFEIKAAQ